MRVVTGRELEVLLADAAQGNTELEIWHNGVRKDHLLISEIVPGVAASSVRVTGELVEDSANFGSAEVTLKFFGLESGTIDPEAVFVVKVIGQVQVSDDTNYRLHVAKFGSSWIEDPTDAATNSDEPFYTRDSGRVRFSRWVDSAIVVMLDRGRRDFLSTKWADSVFNLLEAENSPFDVLDYCAKNNLSIDDFESLVWRANLSRRHSLDPIEGQASDILTGVERYLLASSQDWQDRAWRSFDLYVGGASLQVVSEYIRHVKNILAEKQACPWGNARAESVVRSFYDKMLKQLIASVQQANAAQQVAANIKSSQPAEVKKDKAAVDVDKLQPLRSIDLTFLEEGQRVVLKIEDALETKFVAATVISNDESAIDFREIDGDERTYSAYYDDQKHGTPEFTMGSYKLTLMTEGSNAG